MVWYGMVWYGMVWYGMVWYGMVWGACHVGRGQRRTRRPVLRKESVGLDILLGELLHLGEVRRMCLRTCLRQSPEYRLMSLSCFAG